jgi:hypothetical protein
MDLGAELDALIAQVREKKPDLAPEEPSTPAQEEPSPAQDEPSASDEMSPPPGRDTTQVQAIADQVMAEAETGSAAEGSDAPADVDDLLTHQINEAINGQSADADAAESAAPDTDQQLAEQLQQVIDEAGASTAPTEVAAEPPAEQADSAVVAQIDEMLAEQADDSVAGDFETVNDVLAAQATESQVHATDDAERPEDAVADEGDSAPHEAVSPQPVASGESEFNATAQDVARELDERPESDATADPVAAGRVKGTVGRVGRLKPVVVVSAKVLRRGCGLANRPIRRLSAGSQNMVGYVGLLLLFPGTVMCCYGVIRRLLGG